MKRSILKIPEDKMLRVMLIVMVVLFSFYLVFITKFFAEIPEPELSGQVSVPYAVNKR